MEQRGERKVRLSKGNIWKHKRIRTDVNNNGDSKFSVKEIQQSRECDEICLSEISESGSQYARWLESQGIDKVTKEEYGQKLEENLEELIQWRQFKGKLVLSCCLCRHRF